MLDIATWPGDHIRFVCGRDDALARVKRVGRYGGFEEMLDAEDPRRWPDTLTKSPPGKEFRSLRSRLV
ncbi:hypothetical protein AB0H88_01680 [Nonomuraea sp. NPDC050680]|uniref:hypothetical protein n=1 Tax=Nonomuraea sp. NPDC050680 TaxID=3154630 RepID=UPI003407587A